MEMVKSYAGFRKGGILIDPPVACFVSVCRRVPINRPSVRLCMLFDNGTFGKQRAGAAKRRSARRARSICFTNNEQWREMSTARRRKAAAATVAQQRQTIKNSVLQIMTNEPCEAGTNERSEAASNKRTKAATLRRSTVAHQRQTINSSVLQTINTCNIAKQWAGAARAASRRAAVETLVGEKHWIVSVLWSRTKTSRFYRVSSMQRIDVSVGVKTFVSSYAVRLNPPPPSFAGDGDRFEKNEKGPRNRDPR